MKGNDVVSLDSTDFKSKLEWSLFSLRLGVFVVMIMWTLDKFLTPGHSVKIFEKYYGVVGMGENAAYVIGALQLLLVVGFVLGIKKRLTYGLILLMHAGSTLSSYPQYLDGFNNLLFFAAWPMLSACLALYLLRDYDKKLVLG